MITVTVLALGFLLGVVSTLVLLLALQRRIARFIVRRAWAQVAHPSLSLVRDGAP